MDLTKSKFFLLLTAFATGACIMVLELTASRILAPSFGSNIYVWGSLIGVIMTAMAAGYYLGGWAADNVGDIRILFKNLIASAIYISLIPIFGDVVVKVCILAGLIYGPIISTVILFGLPMTLLAMTSPMVIKFSTEKISTLGLSAGTVYAISTVGSIAGTFVTAFVLIPMAGSRMTILSTALLLFLIGVLGMLKRDYTLLGLFLIPGLLFQPPTYDKNVIYKTESEYNIISVMDYPGQMVLKLNYDFAIQSRMNKNDILVGGYWDYVNVGPLLTKTDNILWLGLAAGTSTKQLAYFYPATIDAVEIDPKIVEVAKKYFGVVENERVRIHVSDGRDFLKKSGKYDVVNVDVFSGGVDAPFHMATKEFFREASEHMTDDGVLTMNALAVKGDEDIANALAYTMKQVFPSVYIVTIGDNRMLIAFKKKKTMDDIRNSLSVHDPKLSEVVQNALQNIREFNSKEGVLLTDDKSNLDELTFNMVRKIYEA